MPVLSTLDEQYHSKTLRAMDGTNSMLERPIVARPFKHAKPTTSYRGRGKRTKAMGAHEPGGPEALRLEDTETLEPELVQVLKSVGDAGVNYADTGMRKGMT